MSEASPMDDRGRVTIRRESRDRLRDRVVQVLTPHGVLLRPVPDELRPDEDLPEALEASGEGSAADEAEITGPDPIADLNLVLGRILPDDDLHDRARHRLQEGETIVVPFSVGLELLFVSHRWNLGRVEALGAADAHSEVEWADVLYTAAEALDAGEVSTVFDAVQCAEALHRDAVLETADEALHETAFPTRDS